MKKVLRITESKLSEIVHKVLSEQEQEDVEDMDITDDPKYKELGIEAKKLSNNLLSVLNKLYKMNPDDVENTYFRTKKIVQALNYQFGRSHDEVFSQGKHSPHRFDHEEEPQEE